MVCKNYFKNSCLPLQLLAPSPLLTPRERAQGVGERSYEYDNCPNRRYDRLDDFCPSHLYLNLSII